MTYVKPIRLIGGIMLSSLVTLEAFAAGNIDTIDKYAWSTNSGWVNFNPTHGGVTVYDDHLEGYAWSENVGWVRLGTYTAGGAHTYANTSQADYGVNKDGSGNLSGYAWSKDAGWINFNPSNSQVTINATTGEFDGYAWGENVGWIHFQNAIPVAYKLRYKIPTLVAPTNLTATAISPNQINLAWTDNSSDETGFKIEHDSTLLTTTVADAISYSHPGLICGTTHNYSVTATNATGESTPITASATTTACTGAPPPVAPTALNATVASQTQINLTWIDNSSDETGFKIERNTALIQTTAAEITSYSDNALTCNTTYNYSVKATNTNGDSTAITTSGTTLACSSTPTISGPPVPSLPPPPTGGNISASRNMGGQTFTDDSTIGENTSVSNVVFAADVENEGLVSNSTIAAGATLTGGTLTGNITNEGTISDVDFVGNKLSGGTLAGTITNSSKIGGTIEDVQLAPKATLSGGQVGGLIKSAPDATLENVQFEKGGILIGGQLSGEISGDPDEPAQIGAAEIMPGSKLSNVRLSPTVKIPEDVELGENVRLPADPENPTLEDFGIEPNELDDMTAERITQLEPAAFSVLTAEDIAKIPPEAFAAIEAEQMANITKEALDGLTVAQNK